MGCTPQLQLALKAPPAPFPLLKGAPRAVRDGENKTQWSAPIGTVHLGCLRSPWWPEKGKKVSGNTIQGLKALPCTLLNNLLSSWDHPA